MRKLKGAAARTGVFRSLLVAAGMVLLSSTEIALAQAQHPPAQPSVAADATPHPVPPATAAPPPPGVSKFEARRVRHACQERANENALKGKEREEFLMGCIFGRSATTRAVRRECRKRALAKGLERTALRDFIHQCVEDIYAGQKPAE